jgi:hypothetical protein
MRNVSSLLVRPNRRKFDFSVSGEGIGGGEPLAKPGDGPYVFRHLQICQWLTRSDGGWKVAAILQ